jgi:hypothetical protein
MVDSSLSTALVRGMRCWVKGSRLEAPPELLWLNTNRFTFTTMPSFEQPFPQFAMAPKEVLA